MVANAYTYIAWNNLSNKLISLSLDYAKQQSMILYYINYVTNNGHNTNYKKGI